MINRADLRLIASWAVKEPIFLTQNYTKSRVEIAWSFLLIHSQKAFQSQHCTNFFFVLRIFAWQATVWIGTLSMQLCVCIFTYLHVSLHSYSLHSAALKLHRLLPISFCKYYAKYPIKVSRGAVVESVERLLKVPVRCNSTDVGSNHAAA